MKRDKVAGRGAMRSSNAETSLNSSRWQNEVCLKESKDWTVGRESLLNCLCGARHGMGGYERHTVVRKLDRK